METQIFYWTGVAVWWVLCGGVILAVMLFAVYLPCRLLIQTRKAVWHWLWAAKIAKYGFTQNDLNHIYIGSKPSFLPDEVELKHLVEWVAKIKERAEKQEVDY